MKHHSSEVKYLRSSVPAFSEKFSTMTDSSEAGDSDFGVHEDSTATSTMSLLRDPSLGVTAERTCAIFESSSKSRKIRKNKHYTFHSAHDTLENAERSLTTLLQINPVEPDPISGQVFRVVKRVYKRKSTTQYTQVSTACL